MIGKKIVYIISDIEKALAFEWIAQHLSGKCDLSFILISNAETPLIEFLKKLEIKCTVISDNQYKSNLAKWIKVLLVLKKERPEVIHIHMWRAMLLGLTTSFLLRTKKRIFTRHHSAIHYVTDSSGLKWDKLCNWLATDIVAISENVRNILVSRDGAMPSKIHLIHHGFDLDYFQLVEETLIERLRSKYDIKKGRGPVIGVISRYLELKGIQFIIPAFQKLKKKFPDAHLILANGHGEFKTSIKNLLEELSLDSYTEIRFEEELAALYKLFDVFVHAPVDLTQEAFGQTYVEALAAGVPSVFTLSGVAPEFIIHKVNAWVVPYAESDAIEYGITQILEDPLFATSLVTQGRSSVRRFTLEIMFSKLEILYA